MIADIPGKCVTVQRVRKGESCGGYPSPTAPFLACNSGLTCQVRRMQVTVTLPGAVHSPVCDCGSIAALSILSFLLQPTGKCGSAVGLAYSTDSAASRGQA